MSDTDDLLLSSWRDTPTRAALVEFVERVTGDGPDAIPPEERIATFDNDGTLWCEKPLPIQLSYILGRLAGMATEDPTLRERQPWKAAYEHDNAWLGGVVAKHYAGDDSDVKVLMRGILASVGGVAVDDYAQGAADFVNGTLHPTLGRSFRDCAYLRMVELLRYLEANGFTTFIASGGDRDFMRPFASDVYGIPPERIIGSSNALRYDADSDVLAYLAEPDVFDDGPVKPIRIWSRTGRRPIVAGGNSNGDIPMLQFAGGGRPALRLLVLHDDAEREFDYTTGSETALGRAADDDWTVVSIKDDWSTVFADRSA
ncbi:putative nonspecific acid phosphatase [Nostocoides japonicum T1-X7]|uniref:Putative nonspecific acid phosphatase n=1 Tax=Nostocoides japonicum T1-X7 TaxID=1194083 RepID=A0A077LTF8_9MICO|nr:HAD family hydrolase [Tetrasphaera japonica]CCH76481.1 putative nonspecific acid phosphatase [Tetrasphaera japonica T1-X7]